jgi:hypothetical protein
MTGSIMNIGLKCMAVVLACCLPSVAQDTERLVAVVDVFSGRPNPRILLRPDAAAPSARAEHVFVTEKLASACEQGESLVKEKAPAYPARLGYRGVLILRQVGQDTYVPVAQVYRGVVRLEPGESSSRCRATGGSALYAKDPGAEFENRIVAAAFDRGLLTKELRDVIRDTLSKF